LSCLACTIRIALSRFCFLFNPACRVIAIARMRALRSSLLTPAHRALLAILCLILIK
jgi:hypothetical protein